MIIRKEQIEALFRASVEDFEARMVPHLQQRFPKQCKSMGEDGLREAIRSGIMRAREYDITREADTQRYIECMFQHGTDFDTNPESSWAGEILRTPQLTGSEKMARIDQHEIFLT